MTQSKIITYSTRWAPLRLETIDVPPIKPSQLLVKTSHAALNPVDIKIKAAALIPTMHRVCREFVGSIVEVGSELRGRYDIGDRVSVKLGNFTASHVGTYVAVTPDSSDIVVKTPITLTNAEAAGCLLVLGTAWQMLDFGTLRPNGSVLVLGGATAVGTFAIQLAKHHYKARSIVATCSQNSSDYVEKFGASATVDYRAPNFRGALLAAAETHGPFDAIIDCAGGYDALAIWPKILQPRETGSFYATCVGDTSVSTTYTETIMGVVQSLPRMLGRTLFGKWLGISYGFVGLSKGPWVDEAAEFLALPSVNIPVDSIWSFADFKTAWDRIESAKARGKVVIDYSS